MSFSQNLRVLREKRGIIQKDMAIKLGITPATYNRYEKGVITPKTETVQKIAHILNVPVSWLFDDDVNSVDLMGKQVFNFYMKNQMQMIIDALESYGLSCDIKKSDNEVSLIVTLENGRKITLDNEDIGYLYLKGMQSFYSTVLNIIDAINK